MHNGKLRYFIGQTTCTLNLWNSFHLTNVFILYYIYILISVVIYRDLILLEKKDQEQDYIFGDTCKSILNSYWTIRSLLEYIYILISVVIYRDLILLEKKDQKQDYISRDTFVSRY